MKFHRHTAYGLTFDSEIPLPELLPGSDGIPDVTIRFGKVPESLPDATDRGIAWQSCGGRLLHFVTGVARYLIVDRQEMFVDPEPGATPEDVRIFLLGSALGALLHEWHILTMHSSAIQTPTGAVLFLGSCAAGKSTLLGAFVKRGYPMLADDKAGIRVGDDGIARVLPGFPCMRLTSRSVDKLGVSAHGAQMKPALEKYILPVDRFCSEAVPLRAAYALETHNHTEIRIERLTGVGRFELLRNGIYRPRFLRLPAQRKASFAALGAAFDQAYVARVLRPEHPFLLDELAGRIEEDLG
jgi:hypothetical protein